jgi:hypothetical protein
MPFLHWPCALLRALPILKTAGGRRNRTQLEGGPSIFPWSLGGGPSIFSLEFRGGGVPRFFPWRKCESGTLPATFPLYGP